VSKSYIFKKLICIIGDGSFLMNVQDLQTIYQNKINVLIILVNNNGYLAIRHTQKEFLKSRYYGTHPDWKLTMPSFKKVAMGFNIKFLTFHDLDVLKKKINTIILYKGPLICEFITSPDQESLFKQGYKKSSDGTFEPQALNEMHPFLQNAISNTNN
jgi:acetolactate synthase-1/2/3 large subunit